MTSETRAPGRHPSLMLQAFNGLMFLGALVMSCVFLNRWLPAPDVPNSGDKIRHLAVHGDEFDTLFIGSSRVNFQILPSLFDQTLAEGGRPTKSFNAGILGMRPPEEGYFLDQVLRQPHRRLRWVVIELVSLEARTPKSRTGSARFAAWHDGPRMLLLWTWTKAEWAHLQGDSSARNGAGVSWAEVWEPMSVWLGHLPPFCRRMANIGQGSSLSEAWFFTDPAKNRKQKNAALALGAQQDGWTPYQADQEMDEQARQNYQKSYEEDLKSPSSPFHDPASDAATEAMLAAVVRAGATPIFFVPPMTTEKYYCPPAGMAGKMTIWNFSDPHRYPELFAPESRHDFIHLNTAGSRQFTRILAQKALELPQ